MIAPSELGLEACMGYPALGNPWVTQPRVGLGWVGLGCARRDPGLAFMLSGLAFHICKLKKLCGHGSYVCLTQPAARLREPQRGGPHAGH